jgi:beta-N-acetylhexosaminidase
MKVFFSIFLSLTLSFGALSGILANPSQAANKFEPSPKAWKFADKQLKKMSVDEKIGQIIQVGINPRFANQDSEFYKDLQRQVIENKIGGIILFGAPIYETVHLVNRMQENAKIPLLIAIDAETGVGMRYNDAINFPWNMAVAATGNPDYARKIGAITGREAKAMGLMHVYAPVVDVNNNAGNPVINVRSFGEDPNDVARFSAAFIEGLQSQGVIATAKHFPGHGDTNVDSHRGLPIIDHPLASLEKTELVPFRAAINAGVGSVMIAHIALPQIDPEEIKPLKNAIQGDSEVGAEIVSQKATVPATLSHKVQTDLLRNEMGFKGLIVTDAMSMSGLTIYFNQEEAGVRAFLAGADLLEKPANVDVMLHGLRDAVKSSRITDARLNESVRRILAWKYELGLFKHKITPIDQIDKIVSNSETAAVTQEVASKAITLVRNDANLVPLDKTKRVAVLGISNTFDDEIMSSLLRGLRDNGVRFNAALLQENSTPEQIAKAREMVKNADVVIAAMYGRVRSGARNSVGLPESGVSILRDLLANDKPLVGVSFGNPYILGSFPQMKTYMVAYGDMSSLQRASANALFGAQDITGRLPISLPGLYPRGTGIQLVKR